MLVKAVFPYTTAAMSGHSAELACGFPSLPCLIAIVMLLHIGGPLAGNGVVSGQHVSSFTHGWDCISCPNNSMLAADLGTRNVVDFNLSDPWWIDEIAKSYAAVTLNNWFDSQKYNGTGEESRIAVARKLRAANPNIKILYYQAIDRGGTSPFATQAIMSHKDWWLKDDHGKVIWFHGDTNKHPVIDMTVPDVQVWFANFSLSLFHSEEDAKNLCDGIFVDGATFGSHYKDVSPERIEQIFKGKMASMQMAQNMFTRLNGGDVWGNPDPAVWEPTPSWYHGPAWNLTLQYHNGGFDPWFGSFAVLDKDGEWNVTLMEKTFNEVIAASNAGHSIVLHSFVGPGTSPFTSRGTQPRDFRVNTWRGSEKVPTDVAGCQEASANLLVQSLAPFLIVANERVFFSYGWFWNLEDGYIPCHGKAVCGMPDEWFPEFSKPLGPPKSAAVKNGTVWTREFQHASVYVDLSDRRKGRIDWK